MSGLYDVHAHQVGDDLIDALRTNGGAYDIEIRAEANGRERAIIGGRPAALPFLPKLSNVDERLARMDGAGIGRQLLASWMDLAGYHLPSRSTQWLCRAQNQTLAALAQSRPERFSAAAMVPLQDPAAAASEVRFAAETLGMTAVQIGTNIEGRMLDDPELDPFWAAVAETGIPVIVHPAELGGSEQSRRYFLHILVGNPAETTAAAAALIFGGVVERFPDLRFLLVHGGGFIPYQIGRLERGFVAAPPQYKAKATLPPSSFLNAFFFDTIVHDARALRYLIDTVGASQVVVGSDYPFPLQDLDPGATLARVATSDEQVAIAGQNATQRFCCHTVMPQHTPEGRA